MDETELKATIWTLLARTFDVPVNAIHDELRRGELERWDSLGHLELMEQIQRHLEIEISPEQALDVESVADVIRIVTEIKSTNSAG